MTNRNARVIADELLADHYKEIRTIFTTLVVDVSYLSLKSEWSLDDNTEVTERLAERLGDLIADADKRAIVDAAGLADCVDPE